MGICLNISGTFPFYRVEVQNGAFVFVQFDVELLRV